MHLSTFLAFLPLVLGAPGTLHTRRAPIVSPKGARIVPGSYIVKLKNGAADSVLEEAVGKLGSVKADHVFKTGDFRGFASKIDDATLDILQSLPNVGFSS